MAAYGDVLDAAVGHLVNIYIYARNYSQPNLIVVSRVNGRAALVPPPP